MEGRRVSAWVDEVVRSIGASTHFDPVIIALDESTNSSNEAGRSIVRTPLYQLYEAADQRLFEAADDALAPVELPSLAADSRLAHDGSGAAEAVREAGADVLVDLTDLRDDRLADCARLGLVRLGERLSPSNSARLFRDIAAGAPLLDVVVEHVASGSEPPSQIAHARIATDPISLHRNRNRAHWQGARLMSSALASFAEGTSPVTGSSSVENDPPTAAAAPSTGTTLQCLARMGRLAVRRQVRSKLFREEWLIAYRERRRGVAGMDTTDGFVPLTSPEDASLMDPFVIEVDGSTHVFFESYSYATSKGTIATAQLAPGGLVSPPQIVLERPYHLSYPFVFAWDGNFYMVPETSQNKTIELYRAERFPDTWVLERVLVQDVVAFDGTLFEHGGRMWLFATVAGRGTANSTELHLFSSDAPFGPWQPHPRNPVVADASRARPAGPIFEHGGNLVRPSQDCSGGYGRAVVFNRIDALTEHDYREAPIGGRIAPDWLDGNVGSHTYSTTERWEVIDARRLRARPPLRRGRRR